MNIGEGLALAVGLALILLVCTIVRAKVLSMMNTEEWVSNWVIYADPQAHSIIYANMVKGGVKQWKILPAWDPNKTFPPHLEEMRDQGVDFTPKMVARVDLRDLTPDPRGFGEALTVSVSLYNPDTDRMVCDSLPHTDLGLGLTRLLNDLYPVSLSQHVPQESLGGASL